MINYTKLTNYVTQKLKKMFENTQKPENNELEQLILHEPVEGSPFYITGNEEIGYFLRIGKWKLTEHFKTPEDIYEELDDNKWNIITNLIATIIGIEEEHKQEITTL